MNIVKLSEILNVSQCTVYNYQRSGQWKIKKTSHGKYEVSDKEIERIKEDIIKTKAGNKNRRAKKCNSCRWREYFSYEWGCGYLLKTGNVRGCVGGQACEKYERIKP